MKNSALLTICIPLYKSNISYVKQAVDSVLGQTSTDWELVLVDGSPEPLLAVREWATSLGNTSIRYMFNDNDTSMAGNWNFAYDIAQTELVTLLHDDDFLHKDYVGDILELSLNEPVCSGYFCGANIVNSNGDLSKTVADSVKQVLMPKKEVLIVEGDEGLASILKANFIFCPSICYRKSQLQDKPFSSDWKMVTDLDFYQKTIHGGGAFVGLRKKLYFYRRHDENQTSKLTQSLERFTEECDIYTMIAEQYCKSQWPCSVKAARSKSMIKLHVLYQLLKSILLLNFTYSKVLLQFGVKRFM